MSEAHYMNPLTTWRHKITQAMAPHGESWNDVVSCTLDAVELDQQFYGGFGGTEGDPFTLWTKHRVYFPVSYDGSEWVESVSREPDGVPTKHVGG